MEKEEKKHMRKETNEPENLLGQRLPENGVHVHHVQWI